MSFDALRKMLQHESPGFQCYETGDRSKQIGYTARVCHRLRPPATADAIALLEAQLGNSGEMLRELYLMHDGMALFCDTQSEAAGLELFRIADWADQTADMKQMMKGMGLEAAELPDWFSSGVVIGQIPLSANFFVIGTTRETSGQIFYMDHDNFVEEPLANDAESLMDVLLADPAQFLYDCGCYTRYSDGESDREWIPKHYVNEASL